LLTFGFTTPTLNVTGVTREAPLTTPAESQEALLEIVNETPADPDALATCKV
jgi:hypothetical protein